jgi:hypothetical protein
MVGWQNGDGKTYFSTHPIHARCRGGYIHGYPRCEQNTKRMTILNPNNAMTLRPFLTLLAATTGLVLFLNLVFQQFFGTFVQYSSVTWWSLSLFIPLSIGMFFLAQKAANSENKFFFHNLIIITIFVKMFLSVFVLMIYKKIFHPETKNFTLPFFLVYFIFTIFETYFMVKLAQKKTSDEQ